VRETLFVRLTRLAGGARLRTDEVEGFAEELPRTGDRFEMTAPGLEFGTRHITTSQIVATHPNGEFTTKSGSRYRVEILADAPGV
jgi:hypothetical protein